MTRTVLLWWALCLSACGAGSSATSTVTATEPPPPPPARRVRQPVDLVGYTHSAEGIERVVARAEELEAEELEATRARLGLDEPTRYLAAVSPHDDYQYAARVYVHLYRYLRARHLVLVGVAHRARDFPEVEGRLVFDSFDAWHGPYGEVSISPLRQALLDRLDDEDALVHDELQSAEHSVEAMVPFLQHALRDASIVSILVPYMSWERLAELAERAAEALVSASAELGLDLAEEVAILVSSDAVHYGDEDWGGRAYADFGVDRAGYERAVARDLRLIEDHLTGELALARLEALFRELVAEDVHEYRITWCGRFSVPFGLALAALVAEASGREPLQGELLRYGTTLEPGRFDPGVSGLGVTAPAGLRHWVGFASIGYR